ncbi:hypothetical protein [Staphylococcus simulans]|uniref:hypothetical protein n=1 Tax=Staphylococcus simulans TaxID=1286 RepID=UPI0021CEF89F|nr:hypothetical protein [Staphylococcus simulans]UXR51005.1 hypothetical protein MUA28_05530 [Staphylococcus simulans]
MEDILFTIILIVVIICYTVYKIDCNHVNKTKNNYNTGGLAIPETKPLNPELIKFLENHRSLAKPKKDKGTRVPPVTQDKVSKKHKIDSRKWLDVQKENGSIPIKQSFVLKSKSGRYFQDLFEINAEHVLLERVMETTDDILKAKKYRTHKEASEEAIKYDFKVMALNTYVKEL